MSEVVHNQVEWSMRLGGHVLGASSFLLPFAMAHAGIYMFIVILVLEAYFTGKSLVYFSEMATDRRSHDDGLSYNNYFTIMEYYLGAARKKWTTIIRLFRGLFMFDVLICTSFYFRVSAVLCISVTFVEPPSDYLINGYYALVFILVAFFLLIFEYGERFVQSWTGSRVVAPSQNNVNIVDSNVHELNVNSGNDDSPVRRQDQLNMERVREETHGYNYKRSLLIFFFMLLIFAVLLFYDTLNSNPDLIESSSKFSSLCPGILQPSWEFKANEQVLLVISIIIFSLMNYAIMLPICIDNLGLPTYASLVVKSKTILVIFLTALPLLVNYSLGESAPVIFQTALGADIYGKLIKIISFVITLIAMLLRVMACCRLIQVLVIDNDSETHYWLIVITLFFSSFVVATWTKSVVYLVIIAGSVNCNLLLIILPRIAYITFKWEKIQQCIGKLLMPGCFGICLSRIVMHMLSIMEAAFGIIIHILLLLTTWQAIQIADPTVGAGCREYFNGLFS